MKGKDHDSGVLEKSNWVKTEYGLYYSKEKIKFIKLTSGWCHLT